MGTGCVPSAHVFSLYTSEGLPWLLDFDGFGIMLNASLRIFSLNSSLNVFCFLSCSIWCLFRPAQKPENKGLRWSNKSLTLAFIHIKLECLHISGKDNSAEPVLISILRGLTHLKVVTQCFAKLCVTAFTLLCSFRFDSDLEF